MGMIATKVNGNVSVGNTQFGVEEPARVVYQLSHCGFFLAGVVAGLRFSLLQGVHHADFRPL